MLIVVITLVLIVLCILAGVIYKRNKQRKTEDWLEQVCTVPVVATIANYMDISFPIDEDMAEIVGRMDLSGQRMIVGYPVLKYEYNGKEYRTEYTCRKMQLISNDNQFIARNHINIKINGNNPREVYMGKRIDRAVLEDYY